MKKYTEQTNPYHRRSRKIHRNRAAHPSRVSDKRNVLIPALSLIVAFSSIVSNLAINSINNRHRERISELQLSYDSKHTAMVHLVSSIEKIFNETDKEQLSLHCLDLEVAYRELFIFIDKELKEKLVRAINNFQTKQSDYLEMYPEEPLTNTVSYLGRNMSLSELFEIRDKITESFFGKA